MTAGTRHGKRVTSAQPSRTCCLRICEWRVAGQDGIEGCTRAKHTKQPSEGSCSANNEFQLQQHANSHTRPRVQC